MLGKVDIVSMSVNASSLINPQMMNEVEIYELVIERVVRKVFVEWLACAFWTTALQ